MKIYQKLDDWIAVSSKAENDAIAEVRASAVNVAVEASAKIIADRNAGGGNGIFIDNSIAEVRKRLN